MSNTPTTINPTAIECLRDDVQTARTGLDEATATLMSPARASIEPRTVAASIEFVNGRLALVENALHNLAAAVRDAGGDKYRAGDGAQLRR